MNNLIGREVEIKSGATIPTLWGKVVVDRGEQVVVDCDGDFHYIAKFRLLTNEYGKWDVPDKIGVYLIRE